MVSFSPGASATGLPVSCENDRSCKVLDRGRAKLRVKAMPVGGVTFSSCRQLCPVRRSLL